MSELIVINRKATPKVIEESTYLVKFKDYIIYSYVQDFGDESDNNTFFFAVNRELCVCSYFEFVCKEEYIQLAHMHTSTNLKSQGLGTAIMEEAIKKYNYFKLPSTNFNDRYHFIEDGLSWTQHFLIKKNLCPPFKYPG